MLCIDFNENSHYALNMVLFYKQFDSFTHGYLTYLIESIFIAALTVIHTDIGEPVIFQAFVPNFFFNSYALKIFSYITCILSLSSSSGLHGATVHHWSRIPI